MRPLDPAPLTLEDRAALWARYTQPVVPLTFVGNDTHGYYPEPERALTVAEVTRLTVAPADMLGALAALDAAAAEIARLRAENAELRRTANVNNVELISPAGMDWDAAHARMVEGRTKRRK